jgi:hypothetical protein
MNITDDQKLRFKEHLRLINKVEHCFVKIGVISLQIKNHIEKHKPTDDHEIKRWEEKFADLFDMVLTSLDKSKHMGNESVNSNPIVASYMREAYATLKNLSVKVEYEFHEMINSRKHYFRSQLSILCAKIMEIMEYTHKTLKKVRLQ